MGTQQLRKSYAGVPGVLFEKVQLPTLETLEPGKGWVTAEQEKLVLDHWIDQFPPGSLNPPVYDNEDKEGDDNNKQQQYTTIIS